MSAKPLSAGLICERESVDLSLFSVWYFPTGLMIGFIAAAPIGPVNILVIQRALQRGVGSALIMGMGAALGDMLFAGIAAFGLSALNAKINAGQDIMRIVGGSVMIGFAVLLWRSHPHLNDPNKPHKPPLRARHMAVALFVMTVSNPATVLWFVATFQAVGFQNIGAQSKIATYHAVLVVVGAFVGSILWWLCIAGFAAHWRQKIVDRHLVIANHIAALVLGAFGLTAVLVGLL
jgi:putative LysE/RhtB family amino acid efflux pump